MKGQNIPPVSASFYWLTLSHNLLFLPDYNSSCENKAMNNVCFVLLFCYYSLTRLVIAGIILTLVKGEAFTTELGMTTALQNVTRIFNMKANFQIHTWYLQ